MNACRRTGRTSSQLVTTAEGGGSVAEMMARLESTYPSSSARLEDRWSGKARLATLAAGCAGSWAVVALVVRLAISV